nr:hypothetical protein CFP56_66791 [Quercus suber]
MGVGPGPLADGIICFFYIATHTLITHTYHLTLALHAYGDVQNLPSSLESSALIQSNTCVAFCGGSCSIIKTFFIVLKTV